MNKRLLLLFNYLLFVIVLQAAPVDRTEAKKKALEFLAGKQAAARGTSQTSSALSLAMEETSCYYVFNVGTHDGFVIVSGDDRAPEILGYSDTGSFDANNIPTNMRAFLQGYADEISWMRQHGVQNDVASSRALTESITKESVGPLLTTQWNQGEPYNNECPGVEYSRCVTGCVATAMAQVMNYHQWPTSESEIAVIPNYSWNRYNSYKNDGHTYGPGDYGPTTIVWQNISDADVAKLMRCCGQSVEMDYWKDNSEAQTFKVANALKTYFNYSATTKYVSRSYYSYDNWINLLYNELSQGRPVIYGASAVDNGHSFVCDGYKYEGTDMFHINWGWGGQSDGYYVLTALAPTIQGTGGSVSGSAYNFCHEAIVGIQKNGETGTVLNVANTVNLKINSITLSRSNILQGETIIITVSVTNNSSDSFDGDIVFSVDGVVSYGANVIVPANTTKDCVISYLPRFIGTKTIMPLIANGEGGYSTDNAYINATLSVGDAMPYGLTVSNITNATANIGWSSVEAGDKWNIRSRPVTITNVDFNDGELPAGWQNVDHNNNGYKWERRNLGNNNYCLSSASYLNDFGDLTPDNWLITSQITLGGSISFLAWGQNETAPTERFSVFVSTDGSNYSQVPPEYVTNHTPTQYTIDLSDFSGNGYVAIIHSSGQYYLNIDDITIVEPASTWTTIENVTTNPYTLSGLTWETAYEVQVQAVFDEATTGWSESVRFSTPRITPIDLTAVATNQSALVSWTGFTDSYKVKYRSAATTAFVDDFESGGQNWSQNTGGIYYFTGQSNHFIMLGNGSRDTQFLITPELDNYESGSTVKFNQRYYINGTTFKVGFSSTTSDISAFTWGSEQTAASSFTLYSEVIPVGTKYIAITTTAAEDRNALLIDDVNIGKTTPAGDWNDMASSANLLNITGLSASTDYDYQIVGVNGSEEVATSTIATFTTATTNAIALANDDSALGTKNDAVIAAWNGITGSVTLDDRTLLGNNQWNTMCLPFDISVTTLTSYLAQLTGASPTVTCKVLDKEKTSLSTKGELSLAFTDPETTILAGTPFIIKYSSAESVDLSSRALSVTIDGSSEATSRLITESNDGNVRFVGQWSSFDITDDNIDEIIYVSSANKIGYSSKARTLKALRAHFWVKPDSGVGVRSIKLDFDDESITPIDFVNADTNALHSSDWYSIDGRRQQGEPTKKGVYIMNGKKIIK